MALTTRGKSVDWPIAGIVITCIITVATLVLKYVPREYLKHNNNVGESASYDRKELFKRMNNVENRVTVLETNYLHVLDQLRNISTKLDKLLACSHIDKK